MSVIDFEAARRGRAAPRRDEYWQSYAKRLRLVLDRLNISEAEAAADHGVTLRTFRRWLGGAAQRPSWRLGFVQFCKKRGVSLDWLIGGQGAMLSAKTRHSWLDVADMSRAELVEQIRTAPKGMLPAFSKDGTFVYVSARALAEREEMRGQFTLLPHVV